MKLLKKLETAFGPHCSFVPDLDIGYICEDHDKRYDRGGDKVQRRRDDKAFRLWIVRHGKKRGKPLRYKVLAWVYWAGVRLFGWTSYKSFGKEKLAIREYKP